MRYRSCPDVPEPDPVDLEPGVIEAVQAVERNERHLAILQRLAEIGMELAEALGTHAKTRLAASVSEKGEALAPSEDPCAPFNKIAQTIRRTLVLEARFAEGVWTSRANLVAERRDQAAKTLDDHRRRREREAARIFRETLECEEPRLESERAERLLEEMEDYLETPLSFGAFEDYRDWPVGEIIAKLCQTLEMEPSFCLPDGEGGWKILCEPPPRGPDLAPDPAITKTDPPPATSPGILE